MASNTQTDTLAVAALLVAATLWGVIWYPLRLIEAQGLSGLWTSLIMFAAAGIVGLPWLRGTAAHLPGQRLNIAMIMLFSAWTNIAFILAVLDGNIVRVLLLFYLSPLWAVLLGRWILDEQIGPRGYFTLALALSGAGIMLWSPQAGSLWPQTTADVYALSAGLSFACLNVFVRRAQHLPLAIKSGAAWWGVVILAGVWLLLAGEGPVTEGTAVYLQAIMLGVFGIVVMTLTVQYGVTRMPIQRSAVILLFELVAGAVSAQWLTDETVLAREWFGGTLIIMAGYIAARRATDHKNP